VLVVWKGKVAEHKQAFAEVREKVSADYIESEKRKRFVEVGKTIKSQIESRLKSGESFDKAAEAVGSAQGVKLTTKTTAAFTMRNRPQDLDTSVLGTLDRLQKGQVSDMVINADKGLFVYAADKKPADLTEANPQFATTRNQLASYMSQMGGNSYLTDLVESELKKTEPKGE